MSLSIIEQIELGMREENLICLKCKKQEIKLTLNCEQHPITDPVLVNTKIIITTSVTTTAVCKDCGWKECILHTNNSNSPNFPNTPQE